MNLFTILESSFVKDGSLETAIFFMILGESLNSSVDVKPYKALLLGLPNQLIQKESCFVSTIFPKPKHM